MLRCQMLRASAARQAPARHRPMKQDLFMDRQPHDVLIILWHDSVGLAVHELKERAPDGAVAHLSRLGAALPHCFYTVPYCDDNQLNWRQPSREANPQLRAIGVASAVRNVAIH
jgi:hypothetical protein